MADRYIKLLLTVIALELLWLAAGDWPQSVSAQPAAIPVIITGIRLDPASEPPLPVAVHGTVTIAAPEALRIWADEPLPVKSVPYTASDRPGD
jgi:hypothetical protein